MHNSFENAVIPSYCYYQELHHETFSELLCTMNHGMPKNCACCYWELVATVLDTFSLVSLISYADHNFKFY